MIEEQEIPYRKRGKTHILKLNRIKLEYGGMKKLLTEKEERLTPEEKNIKANFIKQEEWFVGKGFFGQGSALALSNEKE